MTKRNAAVSGRQSDENDAEKEESLASRQRKRPKVGSKSCDNPGNTAQERKILMQKAASKNLRLSQLIGQLRRGLAEEERQRSLRGA